MRLRTRYRNRKALPTIVQKVRRTQERAAQNGWVEEHENGEPT